MRSSKSWFRIGYFLVLLCQQLFITPVSAQSPLINFKYLTVSDGLSQDAIRCIYQDKDGFMWFGSEGGLDKYDGRRFYRYYDFVRDTALKDRQIIRAIYEDSYNGIWFSCATNGLVQLNKRKEQFTSFRNNPADPQSLSSNKVRKIVEDSHKNLWIATLGGGLNLFNRKDSTFLSYKHNPADTNSIGSNYLTSIAEDHMGNLWLASSDGLLIRFDPLKKKFENIKLMLEYSFNASGFNSPVLFVDSESQVWYADIRGLYRYNQSDKSVKKYSLNNINGFQFLSITSILETERDIFLITTNIHGLILLNSKTGEAVNYLQNPANPFGINSNRLSQVFRSRDGIIWIGSYDNGINIYNKNAKRFTQLMNLVDAPYLKYSSHSTLSLCETPDGQVWMGARANGILAYDPQNKSIKQVIPELKNASVFDMLKDKNNNIWIGTEMNGLLLYDWKLKSIKFFKRFPGNSATLDGVNVTRIFEDSKSRLWLGHLSEGVSLFDPATQSLIRFKHDPGNMNSISNNRVYKIFEDSRGNIWIGTAGGLNLFDQQNNSFVSVPLKMGNGISEHKAAVFDIFEDSKGRLWTGSDYTLSRYDPLTKSFENFPNRIDNITVPVYKILEDRNKLLWLSTYSGICRFDPVTGLFKDFGLSDDIRNLKHNPTSGIKSNKGNFYYGSSQGITVFNPENFTDDIYAPEVYITELSINNTPVSLGMENPVLSQPLMYTEFIKLSHKQSSLLFRFAALNYNNPENNQYAYRLEGFDDHWVNAGNSNMAYYSKIPPGKYIFKVIASNSHGIWNNTGRQLEIFIKPPFWRTWLFRIAAFIIISLFIALLYYNRIQGLQRQKLVLEGIVEQRTKALKDANSALTDQHEELIQQNQEIITQNDVLEQMGEEILVQNAELEQHRSHLQVLVEERTRELEIAKQKAEESDNLKSAFLANMSHEIRTPMNAIVGFSNLLRDDELNQHEKEEFIEIINSNSEMLMVLIDDILDLSLIEADQLTIRKEVISLNEILESIFTYFSKMNRKNKVEIRLNNELHELHLKLNSDSIRIKQILSNLMNNAYKFTENGSIELGMSRRESNLIIYVKDTGVGIDEDNIGKVFERFRKSEQKTNLLYRGTGLGLAISQALAHFLGCDLTVESTLGKGSVFSLVIPDYISCNT